MRRSNTRTFATVLLGRGRFFRRVPFSHGSQAELELRGNGSTCVVTCVKACGSLAGGVGTVGTGGVSEDAGSGNGCGEG